MKLLNYLSTGLLAATLLAVPSIAAEKKAEKATSSKAAKSKYPLKTCLVSDEKLGEMGEPFVFKHEGKEVQLCCKSCQKDFKKDPSKYMKKLAAAEKKAETKH
jgi:YHS domain-containing protein